LLETGFQVWEDPRGRGVVAYADTGAAWVAGGEPLAGPDAVVDVASAFFTDAYRRRRRACFFATEGQLAALPDMRRLLLGEQPVWDPAEWTAMLAGARSLRSQLRRARSHGVTVRRVAPDELVAAAEGPGGAGGRAAPPSPLRAALDALVTRWKAGRAMAAMGFLVRVEPFTAIEERLLFVAERNGVPVALLSMAPVYARDGWLFEDLLRDRSAPNGTSELLVDAGMRHIAALGSRWATLGLAPLAGPVSPWLTRIRRWAAPFFNFRGLEAFKSRLRPSHWEPIWVVYPARRSSLRALIDSLTAFADGSLLRFGWRTLVRGPQPVLAAMAALLVPWTLVLALLDSTRWYPAPWVQAAWVTFDALLGVAIATLAWRWRHGLGVAVAMAVSADVAVTLWQAVTWYLPRATGWPDLLWAGVACAAPSLAAAVLWGTVQRMRVAAGR
jgi:hypothetical protein